jgi:hypothetical protein
MRQFEENKMIITISLSSVPLSLVRPVMAGFNRSLYRELFNKYGSGKGADKYRIYIPVSGNLVKVKEATVPQTVLDVLTSKGYKVVDYRAGLAVDKSGKRQVRIGKLLTDPRAKKVYDNDPQRSAVKNVGAWIVISRHPYDIMGMSFDRGWTSCMHITNGGQSDMLKEDVKAGTLVAYLIRNTDKNINAPVARIAIKPYLHEDDDTIRILTPGPVYGTAGPTFTAIVSDFCSEYNASSKTGMYVLPRGLYDDLGTDGEMFFVRSTSDIRGMKKKDKLHAASSLATTPEVLSHLADTGDEDIISQVAYNTRTPDVVLQKIVRENSDPIDGSILYKIARNMSSSATTLDLILATKFERAIPVILEHPNTSMSSLSKLCADTSLSAQLYIVARRLDLSESLMLELSRHSDNRVRGDLASNPSLLESAQMILANDSSGIIRQQLATNRNIATSVLDLVIKDTQDPDTLSSIILSKNITVEQSLQILNSTGGSRVAQIVSYEAINLSRPVVDKMLDIFLSNVDTLRVRALLKVLDTKMMDKVYASGIWKNVDGSIRVFRTLQESPKTSPSILSDLCEYSEAKYKELRKTNKNSYFVDGRKEILLTFASNPNISDALRSKLAKSSLKQVREVAKGEYKWLY